MKLWNLNLRTSLLTGILVSMVATPLLGHVPRRSVISGQIVISKWAQPLSLAWRMNDTRTPNVDGVPSVENAFRQAFQPWASVSTATIAFAEGPISPSMKPGVDQINLITAHLTAAEWAVYGVDAISFTSVTTSATTGQILEADILFNPNVGFSTDSTRPPSLVDLQGAATHEVGHLLGLDHSPLASAIMFPLVSGGSFARTLTADDTIGVSTLYPTTAFTARGSIDGTVRTTTNVGIFGAIVVAVGQNGQPVTATITDPNGRYTLVGLPAGNYTIHAEPMDGPFGENNLMAPLSTLYPSSTVFTDFTTRFR
jgi:hypothetical protein